MGAMNWSKLMSSKRTLGVRLSGGREHKSEVRSPYTKDFDKIIYSSAFRRLKDKTQVHIFPNSDYFRTRLTHSLEVSTVGRSLGVAVARKLSEINEIDSKKFEREDFGAVVAAACLAHDLGNPPFGHAGEEAIRHWFSSDNEKGKLSILYTLNDDNKNDLVKFEGNAQGFRLLTRQQSWRNEGGLRLTCATLGAFQKYPKGSMQYLGGTAIRGNNKFGYFQADRETFEMVAEELGLLPKIDCKGEWCRHPLAYLVEAADDICNRIADLEDGYKYGKIEYDEIEGILTRIAHTGWSSRLSPPNLERHEKGDVISYLRAKAIGALIKQTVEAFKRNLQEIMTGTFNGNLMKKIDSSSDIKTMMDWCRIRLFKDRDVLQAELAGFEVIHRLLEIFTTALREKEHVEEIGSEMAPRNQKIVELLEQSTQLRDERYDWLICATDYISGMTDRYAVDLYRRLSGITVGLPHH